MSIDGAQNNVEKATSFAFDSIQDGIKNNNLTDAVSGVDQELAGSQLNGQEKLAVSQALGSRLQQAGLLPRVLVDYSSQSFESLSNGDRYIQSVDLDGVLQAGIESSAPVKGLIARQLRTNMGSIALSHEDASSFHDDRPSDSEEIGKGISRKDLSEWGEGKTKGYVHGEMSAKLMKNFGNAQAWRNLAGSDNLLSGSELDDAKVDTVRFNAEQRNTLAYIDDNFGGIRASSKGDSNFKVSLSDVVDWSAKHGVASDTAEAPTKHQVEANLEANVDERNKVGSNARLGLQVIEAGIKDGTLTENIRQFDSHLVNSDLSTGEVTAIRNQIGRDLNGSQMLKRTMGQFVVENFDQLKGDNSYIHPTELDAFLQSEEVKRHPIEGMIMANLRHNSDTIAMAHDDVRHDDSDSAEKSRGISLDDAIAMRDEDVETRQHVDMSKNMLSFFGSTERFTEIARGDDGISKDDLDTAKRDSFKYSADERSTLTYMRENYGSIKSASSGDGSKISLSDIVNHAGKYGITGETLAMEQANRSEARPLNGRVEAHGETHRHDAENGGPVFRREGEPRPRQPERQPERQERAPERHTERPRRMDVGDASEATKVTIGKNQRIWNMALEKYGTPAIEAIFEANGMQPSVVERNGQTVILDPAYKAGDEIVLPAAQDLPELTERYRAKADHLRDQLSGRAGEANEPTSVQLMYGDTLSALALQKYGRHVPIEALYEANNLPPRFEKDQQGRVVVKEPIYFAGRSYCLPPIQDIDRLARSYVQKHFRR